MEIVKLSNPDLENIEIECDVWLSEIRIKQFVYAMNRDESILLDIQDIPKLIEALQKLC